MIGPRSKTISLLRQKHLRLRDRGAVAAGFLGDHYEHGEIALGFFLFAQTVSRLCCTVTTHYPFLTNSISRCGVHLPANTPTGCR
jgi:hypothetical protein